MKINWQLNSYSFLDSLVVSCFLLKSVTSFIFSTIILNHILKDMKDLGFSIFYILLVLWTLTPFSFQSSMISFYTPLSLPASEYQDCYCVRSQVHLGMVYKVSGLTQDSFCIADRKLNV